MSEMDCDATIVTNHPVFVTTMKSESCAGLILVRYSESAIKILISLCFYILHNYEEGKDNRQDCTVYNYSKQNDSQFCILAIYVK